MVPAIFAIDDFHQYRVCQYEEPYRRHTEKQEDPEDEVGFVVAIIVAILFLVGWDPSWGR